MEGDQRVEEDEETSLIDALHHVNDLTCRPHVENMQQRPAPSQKHVETHLETSRCRRRSGPR